MQLVKTTSDHLSTLFAFQLDSEANYQAAFTAKNPADKKAYFEKWNKLLLDPTIHMRTILIDEEIVGSVSKYEIQGEAQITYWIGKKYWGKGIAAKALKGFLKLETLRPLYARVAYDNFASQKVMEKCGFLKIDTERGFANARNEEIEEFLYKLD